MADLTQLMNANLLEVFNERDEDRRLAAIERTYTADVVFSDPEEVVTGRAALNAKARTLLAQSPSFVFAPQGPILINHDLGYLVWGLGPAGAPPVVRGVDIALTKDGLISRLYTMLLTD